MLIVKENVSARRRFLPEAISQPARGCLPFGYDVVAPVGDSCKDISTIDPNRHLRLTPVGPQEVGDKCQVFAVRCFAGDDFRSAQQGGEGCHA